MITMRVKELVRDCMRKMERATPESTPRIKFDKDEVNNLLGPKRVLCVSTQKRIGGGTTIHQQVLQPQVGEQLHGGNLHYGISDIFLERLEVFPLTGNGDSLVSDGRCTRDTNPHAMSRSRTRGFSRAVFHSLSCQRLSHA